MRRLKSKLKVREDVKEVTYWRNPTKEEIKFGYGAVHYKDFDIQECLNKDGTIKKIIYDKIEGLKYYSY